MTDGFTKAMGVMQSANGPPGIFGRGDGGAAGPVPPSAKRMRAMGYEPAGKFNQQGANPLEPLLTSGKRPGSLTDADRLQTTQTSKTLAVNTVRYIPSLFLPSFNSKQVVELHKGIMPGDVVFNLRCNTDMVARRYCFSAGRKAAETVLLSINLATVNYLLNGLQRILRAANERLDHSGGVVYKDIESDTGFTTKCGEPETLGPWFRFFMALYSTGPVTTGRLAPFQTCLAKLAFAKLNREDVEKYLGDPKLGYAAAEVLQARFDLCAEDHAKITEHVLEQACVHFVYTYCPAAGVFIGSDKQGGDHLTSPNPASFAPNDYVGVVQVAGKNVATSNMWNFSRHAGDHVIAGDTLGFMLEKATSDAGLRFELSSNPQTPREVNTKLPGPDDKEAHKPWLLTPRVLRCVLSALRRSGASDGSGTDAVVSSRFFKFCIANHMSRARNVPTQQNYICCGARCAANLLPIEIFLRFGVQRLPNLALVSMEEPDEVIASNSGVTEASAAVVEATPVAPMAASLAPTKAKVTASANARRRPPMATASAAVPPASTEASAAEASVHMDVDN